MHKSFGISLLGILMLVLGGLIYILFRENVIFTSWLASLIPYELPYYGTIINHNTLGGYIFLFSLADALWYGSLLLFDFQLRSNTWYSKLMTLLTMALPFIFELAQLWNYMPGTFDWIDIIIYLLTLLIFILCSKNFYYKR